MLKYILFFSIMMTNVLFSSVDEYIARIKTFIGNVEYQKANQEFELAIEEYDANASLYIIGGQVAVKLDRLDDANRHYIKAIELDNKKEDYRLAQKKLAELKNAMTSARKTYDNGLINDAIIEYEKLTDTYSENAIVFYNLGRVYKVNEEYDLAVQNYKKAGELNPFEDKYSIAITAIAQQMAKEGDTEYRRQEFETAIENYKKAIHFSPDYTTAYFKLARTYLKMKDYENTRIIIEQNLAVDPQQEQSEKMLGDVYRETDNYEKAIEHYNRAISINENYYKAHYSIGALFLKEGQSEKAREALKISIKLEPNYAKAYGALGTVEQELGNVDSAIENFIHAIELDPGSYKIYYRLSSAYNLQKQYENAKMSAKDCLNIKRNYAPAYYELGVSEKALGNKVAATDAFEKAKKDKNWRKSAQYELDMLKKGF